MIAELAALRKLEDAAKAFKKSFDKGFPNSLNAIEARDRMFDALSDLDRLRGQKGGERGDR